MVATFESREDPFQVWQHWAHITGLGLCDDGATTFTLMAIKAHLGGRARSGSWINMSVIANAAFADQAILSNHHRGTQS